MFIWKIKEMLNSISQENANKEKKKHSNMEIIEGWPTSVSWEVI